MKLLTNIENIPPFEPPIALSIGTYDGLHLGHQKIIKALYQKTHNKGSRIIITFLNHPLETLDREKKITLITSIEHRLSLLKKFGLQAIFLLPFNNVLAQKSYREFLSTLYKKLPFCFLVLGEGSTIGKEKKGNQKTVLTFAKTKNFQAIYIKKKKKKKKKK